MKILPLLITFCSSTLFASAIGQTVDVFQCLDRDQALRYQDRPCEQGDQVIRQIRTTEYDWQPPSGPAPADDPVVEPASSAPDSSAGGLRKNCGGIRILSHTARNISLEFTTAPALDGFWGDRSRGPERRPDLDLETFAQDINDTAACARVSLALPRFTGRLNRRNNLGRDLRGRIVARSTGGRQASARSGYFPDGRIQSGQTLSGTYCFWKVGEAGPIADVGCSR